MAEIVRGRSTDAHEGEVVLFLIGLRVNRVARVREWLPAARAMRPMLSELYADPTAGFLGHTMALVPRGPLLVQYWRSTEHLLDYAHSAQGSHRPAWRAF